jgi:hypothetical protein
MKKVEFFFLLSKNVPMKNFNTKEPKGLGSWIKSDNKNVVKLVESALKRGDVKIGSKYVSGRIIKLR